MFKKTKNIGRAIADRVKGYHVWDKLPKKKLKKHPTDYILCPDFSVTVPKRLSKEATETPHKFTVKIVAKTRPMLRSMLDHMIACAQEDIIVGDKRFELCGFKESAVKIGMHMADLTYTFKLRQLSYEELKERKITEDKNG
ncbi:hypothetical protein KA005_56010 [bacterium]|nr:hypothetical protein [bacterium]